MLFAPSSGSVASAPLDPALGGPDGHLHLDASISPVVRTEVDLDAYLRRERTRVHVDGARLDEALPLEASLRRALGVLQRLEASALAESRAMLATWTANEARITAFLAAWMVERHWQARALRDLLDHAAGAAAGAVRTAHGIRPLARLRRLHVDRIQPLIAPAWTALAGEAVTAGHMARMAIQESQLLASLRALAPRLDGHAREVVETVAERHEDSAEFFAAEAIARISRSPREARLARIILLLDSPWDGGGVSDPELPAALGTIGADPADRAALRRAREEITRLLPGPLPDRTAGARPHPMGA